MVQTVEQLNTIMIAITIITITTTQPLIQGHFLSMESDRLVMYAKTLISPYVLVCTKVRS